SAAANQRQPRAAAAPAAGHGAASDSELALNVAPSTRTRLPAVCNQAASSPTQKVSPSCPPGTLATILAVFGSTPTTSPAVWWNVHTLPPASPNPFAKPSPTATVAVTALVAGSIRRTVGWL